MDELSYSHPIRAIEVERMLAHLNTAEKKAAPQVVHYVGDPRLVRSSCRVSIVGSRKASDESLARATEYAKRVANLGGVVVSGLAEGVDTSAHLGAMRSGGRTIGVLGTSLFDCYPRKNASLQGEIGRNHLLVSQFAEGYPVTRKNFPMRNRTMALFSDATIIVEAGEKSGTKHQALEALRLGRVLFLDERLSVSWSTQLVEYGADWVNPDTIAAHLGEVGSVIAGDPAF